MTQLPAQPDTAMPSQQLLLELLDYRMPFGKYQGVLLLRLPEAYLAWFARKGMPPGKLGILLETALVVRSNGLEPVMQELAAMRRSPLSRR
jgi:uncharacterized protein (DUF3820 family)